MSRRTDKFERWLVKKNTLVLMSLLISIAAFFAIDKKTGKEKIFKLVKFRTMSNKKDKDGNLQFDTPFDRVEASALKFSIYNRIFPSQGAY